MTYEEKKSLYESIMQDIAKTVKKALNESFPRGGIIEKLLNQTKEYSIKEPDTEFCMRTFTGYTRNFSTDALCYKNGETAKKNIMRISQFTDDCFEKVLYGEDAKSYIDKWRIAYDEHENKITKYNFILVTRRGIWPPTRNNVMCVAILNKTGVDKQK